MRSTGAPGGSSSSAATSVIGRDRVQHQVGVAQRRTQLVLEQAEHVVRDRSTGRRRVPSSCGSQLRSTDSGRPSSRRTRCSSVTLLPAGKARRCATRSSGLDAAQTAACRFAVAWPSSRIASAKPCSRIELLERLGRRHEAALAGHPHDQADALEVAHRLADRDAADAVLPISSLSDGTRCCGCQSPRRMRSRSSSADAAVQRERAGGSEFGEAHGTGLDRSCQVRSPRL
jgi:hypothetical protein